MLRNDSAFLNTATMLSLRRDERNQRLLIRFCAVNHKDLSVRRNTFGVAIKFGTGATQITKAPEMLIGRFFAVEPRLDSDLEQHCRTIQKQLVIDSASDEKRLDGVDALTSRQKVTLDKAHSPRRILSRTFNKDDLMKTVLDTNILGKQSFRRNPNQLQNSSRYALLHGKAMPRRHGGN